ncbi:Pentatricopeptide repeat [Dillenia turbinata]|uniref:Pentatricopeptide repeat n=1 Tax=Dillenia turbinata TaxID=194707 RepID=A0AAN8Z9A9_9MAGN
MLSLRNLCRKNPNSLYLASIFSRSFSLTSQNPSPIFEEPSTAYYDNLINAAGKNNDFKTLHHLLIKRYDDGFFTTKKTFEFITSESNSSIADIFRTLASLDEGFCRKMAFDSLIHRLCKLNRTDEALKIVGQIVSSGFEINAVSFHPILNSFTRKKKMDGAWKVLEFMREIGIKPDLTAYNYVLTAFCFNGELTSAADLLTRMVEEEGLGADARTYDALVLGTCRSGNLEGALMLLRRMEDDGVPMLYSTPVHVITAMLRKGNYAQAVEFVKCYVGRDKCFDEECFGILGFRLVNRGRVEEAILVLEEMVKRGLEISAPKLRDFYELNVKNKL